MRLFVYKHLTPTSENSNKPATRLPRLHAFVFMAVLSTMDTTSRAKPMQFPSPQILDASRSSQPFKFEPFAAARILTQSRQRSFDVCAVYSSISSSSSGTLSIRFGSSDQVINGFNIVMGDVCSRCRLPGFHGGDESHPKLASSSLSRGRRTESPCLQISRGRPMVE